MKQLRCRTSIRFALMLLIAPLTCTTSGFAPNETPGPTSAPATAKATAAGHSPFTTGPCWLPGPSSLRPLSGHDGALMPALELAFVDVAFLGRPELEPCQVTLVDRMVELARRDAVTAPVHVFDSSLEREVELLVRLRAGCEHDRVDWAQRFRRARVQVDHTELVALDRGRPRIQAVGKSLAEQSRIQ